jgi:hypothetical protein
MAKTNGDEPGYMEREIVSATNNTLQEMGMKIQETT